MHVLAGRSPYDEFIHFRNAPRVLWAGAEYDPSHARPANHPVP